MPTTTRHSLRAATLSATLLCAAARAGSCSSQIFAVPPEVENDPLYLWLIPVAALALAAMWLLRRR